MSDQFDDSVGLEDIGPWTEIKHEIVRKYAHAYSTILTARGFYHAYVDAFAGAGHYVSRKRGEVVPGSAAIALELIPPFQHYHLVELDKEKVQRLGAITGNRTDVTVYFGDCNKLLTNNVLPQVSYSDYRRALCILDPYGLDLRWETVQAVADTGAVEIFLNFPTMDINRNPLRQDPAMVDPRQAQRMTAFWGDDSWRADFYRPDPQLRLFENQNENKIASNDAVAEAYRRRLREVAGFDYVPEPVAMRNSINRILYYLFFASHNAVAGKIVEQIFGKYR